MSFQVSPNSIPSPIIKPASAIRKTANFPPSIWGDRFTTYEADDKISVDRKEQHIKELKEEVKMELLDAADEPSKQLKLIDAIQRLGVEYHFEKEIDEALQHIYHEETHDVHNNLDNDLYNVALRFRLLRQQGHNISCDIFNKFKDNNGDFSESLIEDTLGMLALYEATHLRKHGEDILDEALTFTSFHLEIMKSQLSNPLATQVHHALKRPIRKGLPRLEARYYMPIYQQIGSHNQTLLELAKMDFNLLQSLHKKELCDITRWWKDLDVKMNVPFARDRIVELYFWVLGVYFEPQYSISRNFLTKVLGMASIIDDTYDVYGTFDELELFTEAVERWDVDCKDQLPEYMKFIYQTLLDVYEEIEREVAKEGRSYPFHYAKDAFVKLVKAYFIEAKWSNEEYVPTMDEYMSIALPSSGYHATAATSFIGMGEIVTKEAFDWIHDGVPKIIRAIEKISRLMDDIVSHKFEQKRGHVVSSVECYMKEYGVVEEQVVYDEFRRQIVNAWKDINEECLNPTDVPMPLLTRILNLARVMDVIYKEKDGYTHVGKEMKDRITLLLIDQIPI